MSEYKLYGWYCNDLLSACSFNASSAKSALQSGHVWFWTAQSWMHWGWNICPFPQLSSMTCSPCLNSSRHTHHCCGWFWTALNFLFRWLSKSPISLTVGTCLILSKNPGLAGWGFTGWGFTGWGFTGCGLGGCRFWGLKLCGCGLRGYW